MKKSIRFISLILTLFIIALSMYSCGETPSAGKISAINEDGSMIITDNNGNTYTVLPYLPEETTETPVENYNGVVNVFSHGAKGDGITDDTDAFQSAINALENGGVLYIPTGTYKITKSIVFSESNIIIEGSGASTVLSFAYSSATSDTPDKASLFSFSDGVSAVQIRDFSIVCENKPDKKGVSNGIYFGQCNDIAIEDVDIRGFNNSGIFFSEDEKVFSKHIVVKNCRLSDNYFSGISIGHVDGITVSGCDLYKNGIVKEPSSGYGLYVSENASPKNIRIFGNRIYENLSAGIKIYSGEDIDILNNNVVSNKLHGIYAAGEKVKFVIISNNFITDMISASLENSFQDETFCAVYTGTSSESDELSSFTVMNNTVKNFNLTSGNGFGFVVLTGKNTYVNITDNIFEGNTVKSALYVKNKISADTKSNVMFTNNMFRILNSSDSGIIIENTEKLTVSQNKLFFNKLSGEACMAITSDKPVQLISSYNIIRDSSGNAKDITLSKTPLISIRDGDIFNGKDSK